jgi:hypothetical protein
LTEQAASCGSAACLSSRPSSTIRTISPTSSIWGPSSPGCTTTRSISPRKIPRASSQPGVGERLVQALDLGPVDLGEVRVQPHRRRRVGGELLLHGRLAGLQVVQALLQAIGTVALDQGLDELVEPAPDLGELALLAGPGSGLVPACPVDLRVVGRDELLDQLGGHQALPPPSQNELFEWCPADAPTVRARALATGGGAGQVVAADRRHTAAAAAAVDQTGEQVLRPAALPEPGLPRLGHALALADALLPGLDRRPELVAHFWYPGRKIEAPLMAESL